MKLEPTENDQKISLFYIIAYSLFLLVPLFALYKGWQTDNIIVIIGSIVAILGFSFLLTIAIRHNRKVEQRNKD